MPIGAPILRCCVLHICRYVYLTVSRLASCSLAPSACRLSIHTRWEKSDETPRLRGPSAALAVTRRADVVAVLHAPGPPSGHHARLLPPPATQLRRLPLLLPPT